MSLRRSDVAAGLAARFVVGIASLAVAGIATAQEFRGTILGRVTDASAGAIPHVTVVVINEDTNVASEALTQADGAYSVPFLNPGTYRVEVAVSGFKKFVRSRITVEVTQHVAVDATLEVGDISETVEVRALASLLDRASGGPGPPIDNPPGEALPPHGRNAF